MTRLYSWKLFLLVFILEVVAEHRVKDMIYSKIDHVAACFRIQNGTHQFGCSSKRSGNIGAIHFVENEADLLWIENNSTAGPYSAVLPFSMFTRSTLVRLRETNNVNGVLLTNITEKRPSFFSPESKCPNRYSGAKQCNDVKPWNPHGSNILLENWPFPIFFMNNEKALQDIRACFVKHNAHDLDTQRQRSLCALEMKSFMFAAVDSKTCIRRNHLASIHSIGFCDSLGGLNIHWSLIPVIEETDSIILVTARADSTSMFDGLVPGAGSTITGLVTFLATAFYLNSLYKNSSNSFPANKTNVMFSLLNGEAYDYIGSSRMVYDIKDGKFQPFRGKLLDFKQISSVIDIGQLGSGELFLHTSNSDNTEIVSDLKNSLSATILKDSIPPTSVNSFLKVNPKLPTVVIANYGEQFVNRYYHSILDDEESLKDEKKLSSSLAKVVISLGNTLYKNIMKKEPPKTNSEQDIEKLISYMLPCYLNNTNCSLFTAAFPPGYVFEDRILPLYISVRNAKHESFHANSKVLALFTGEEIPEFNASSCNENNFFWMRGEKPNSKGICINSTVFYSLAVSPAFSIKGYDMTSGLYSTWTESVWEVFSVRMFLKPSAATERLTLVLGSSVSILSFVLVWFVNSRAKIIFNTSTVDL